MMSWVEALPLGLAVFFCSGPLQSVQRALQAAVGIYVGVDNLGVVRHVGRLLDGNVTSRPAELVKGGDLITLIGRMLRLRGLDTVRITKVKGHADEGVVRDGGVRELDRLAAMRLMTRLTWVAAGLNCRSLMMGEFCWSLWSVVPGDSDTASFFNAISRAVVNHVDGDGTAPDSLVWSVGTPPKKTWLVHAVQDHVVLPGPSIIWEGEWVALASAPITAADIEAWPYSVGVLGLRMVLIWELGGVSFVELSLLYELRAGERIALEKAVTTVSEA